MSFLDSSDRRVAAFDDNGLDFARPVGSAERGGGFIFFRFEAGGAIGKGRKLDHDEAMKVLRRDHHLGLEPVVHLNRIPEQFVCHLRYKCEKKELSPGRPILQIGHHMIKFNYLEGGGHRIQLPDGPAFNVPESKMKLNEWIDLIIEYKLGTIRISVNGHSKSYEHEKVTIINERDKLGPRFTWKGGPGCRIVFDSVSLWNCEG